ncbi:MAG TPA: 2-oxoglutarate and iron-dependent oxygenase domain-containing protein [Acidimicrobiales bacterium]|nr:2-oxoglutarate and iron-dependent oxygenase domain-containing protein [Acidimicrobiales bacterium]
MTDVPVIDITPLREEASGAALHACSTEIDRACRDVGFFVISGHGVPGHELQRLDAAARKFFARPETEKADIAMARGGLAWRGWFPERGELTAGRPDDKEGIYFGEELAADDPRVVAGRPLHGPNLFPAEPPQLREAVLDWIESMTSLGRIVVRGLALALGLDADWFDRTLTADPMVLFRIFRYPARTIDEARVGVAEHTDYGLVTILAHDGSPGLQVRPRGSDWIDVPVVDGTFVVNLGDMLERMTAGRYRSTPHRVRNPVSTEGPGSRDRLSFPFFFDPGWDVEVAPIPVQQDVPRNDDPAARWDGRSVHDGQGTYGDYLTAKVAQVFPELGLR